MEQKQHPFLRTLGPGPYRFVGFGQIHTSETFGAKYIGPNCDSGAGTCAHCGHGIMNIYIVRTGDGKTHGVGSDCIGKLHSDDAFENMSDVERQVKAMKKKQGQERREKQRRSLRDECAQLAQANYTKFDVIRPYWTCQFATMTAYCVWYLKREHTMGGYKIFQKRILEALNPENLFKLINKT